ncbi:(+)-neomenthol dehydrogenase, partial [Quercus suber]
NTNEWAKEVLGNAESLTEKKDSLETKGWPRYSSPYIISKAAMNACTRIVAKSTIFPSAESVVKLALLPNDGPSGLFFYRNEVTTFD